MKTIDTNAYVSVLQDLIADGREVSLLISGSSMEPFLKHQRDYICFRAPDRELAAGDMVFYRRENGQYIMHRIYRVAEEGYYLVGDNQVEIEGPLDRSQIFALITKVKRNGRWLTPEDRSWKFFARLWPRTIPVRAFAGRVQRKLRRMVKGQD